MKRGPKTASQIERIRACPASETMPHADYESDHSEAGRERHAKLEAMIKEGELPHGIRQDDVPLDARTEVAYRYNVATGEAEFLQLSEHRAYPETGDPFDIFGTVDLFGTDGATLVVSDWKGNERKTPAVRNDQLLTNALALSKITGLVEVDVWLAYVNDDLEVQWVDRAHYTAERLKQHAADLREIFSIAKPAMASGPHCKYCPAFVAYVDGKPKVCIELLRIAEAAVALKDNEQLSVTIPAARLLKLRDGADMFKSRSDKALWDLTLAGPVAVDGGMLTRKPGRMVRNVADPGLALNTATTLLGSAADVAFERLIKTTVGALEKLKSKPLMEALEKNGAIKKSQQSETLVVEPAKEKGAA